MLRNIIQEQLVLPVSDLITGQSVHKYLRFLLKSQYWSREQLDDFQNKRLRELIKYAYDNVPFYHDVMDQRGLTPDDVQTKDDLMKMPIINKDLIRKEGMERFTSKAMPKSKMIKSSSSGSTGEPFSFYVTKLNYSVNLAANLRGWYGFGWRLGDKYVKLSQNTRDSKIKKLQDWMTRDLYLESRDLSDESIRGILNKIEAYKPMVVRSYPDPLYFMAKYRLEHKDDYSFSPQVVTTTGNVLHDHVRKLIEEAFGCEVYDAYASEAGSNVFECPTHCGYHSSEEYGITEIVDEKNQPIKSGTGRLVTTDLWNYAHPFIRYDVQDLVELDPEPCICGRVHLHIKRLLGRDNEVLVTSSGKRYIVHHFTYFFEPTKTPQLNHSIDQFQIIQHADNTVSILLVVNENYNDQIADYIQEYWERELETSVDVQVVDRIPLMHNNKRRFIIIES